MNTKDIINKALTEKGAHWINRTKYLACLDAAMRTLRREPKWKDHALRLLLLFKIGYDRLSDDHSQKMGCYLDDAFSLFADRIFRADMRLGGMLSPHPAEDEVAYDQKSISDQIGRVIDEMISNKILLREPPEAAVRGKRRKSAKWDRELTGARRAARERTQSKIELQLAATYGPLHQKWFAQDKSLTLAYKKAGFPNFLPPSVR